MYATTALDWCPKCGGTMRTRPHQCGLRNSNQRLSIPSISKVISVSEEEFTFSPPLPTISAGASMVTGGGNSGLILQGDNSAPTLSDTVLHGSGAAADEFQDRLEDTKWDSYWSAPTSSSLSSFTAAIPNGRSPSQDAYYSSASPTVHNPVVGANTGAAGVSTNAASVTQSSASSPPQATDKNVWNVFVLSEYQLFKPSSAPMFEGILPSSASSAKENNFWDQENHSSRSLENSNLQPSARTVIKPVSRSSLSSGSVTRSSLSEAFNHQEHATNFPSKFSEAKDYVGHGIADLLSPVKQGSSQESGSKFLAPAKSGGNWSSNSEDDELGDGENLNGTTRKLFVGRIPKDATEASVVGFFSQFGIVELADVNPDRGCCFITFSDAATVDAILEGKNVKYLDLEGVEVCARRYVVIEKDKIFVRGLANGTSKDELFKYFKQFGRIVNITLHQNKNGAHPFAFVRFARQKSVNQIMARNDHVICGKTVHCLRAHRQDGSAADAPTTGLTVGGSAVPMAGKQFNAKTSARFDEETANYSS